MPISAVTTDDDASIDPAQKMLPAWKAYELEVDARLRAVDKLATIHYDAKREGKVSKANRQIDVLAETVMIHETTRIVVECKAYKRPLDVGKVDEFIGKLQDLGVGLGLLYSINGVTPAARLRAENNVLPEIRIRDLSHITAMPVPTTPIIEENWVDAAAHALGYIRCPQERCWGEVLLDEWPDEGLKAGRCDSCGTLIAECAECEETDSVEVGTNTCFSCNAVYYVDHDGKGEPISIERFHEDTAETESARSD
ncbi:restriction endonuclease [Cryobacterium sp. AP23]